VPEMGCGWTRCMAMIDLCRPRGASMIRHIVNVPSDLAFQDANLIGLLTVRRGIRMNSSPFKSTTTTASKSQFYLTAFSLSPSTHRNTTMLSKLSILALLAATTLGSTIPLTDKSTAISKRQEVWNNWCVCLLFSSPSLSLSHTPILTLETQETLSLHFRLRR